MSESNEYNPYTAGVMSLPATGEPRYSPVQPQEYNPYNTPAMRGTTSSGYPDMTPGPAEPKKSILSTSFNTVPSDTRPQGFWDTLLAPGEGNVRVGTAMREAYRDTPPFVGPAARDWINRQDRLPRAILGTAADVGDMLTKGASAVGTGVMSNVSEFLGRGDPQAARDLNMVQQVLPVAQAHMPPVMRPLVREYPNYTGDLKAGDVTIPERSPVGPASPSGGPSYATPISTPEDALRAYKPLIKSAESSDFRLRPEFTQNWIDSLDAYGPKSAAGRAGEPGGNAVTKMVDDLRGIVKGPLDNVTSIQEVDGIIQRHLTQQQGQGGDPNMARQIRGVLQDFRNRYGNVPDGQYTGSPQGIKDFQDSLKSYAAYSRLREVQGIIDSTQGNPNRATLLSSRIHGFLNDADNVKGWTDAEKASLRKAADAGFVAEWMRAQGSRLVGIGAAVSSGMGGQAASVPAQVGLSYMLRNAAENMRLAKIKQAMEVLGQRVEQPGTVPPPNPGIPPQSLMTSLRYAPLVGLLGQAVANQEANR